MPFHRGRSFRGRFSYNASTGTSGRQTVSTSHSRGIFDPSIPCLGEITLFSLDKEINADLRASSGVSKNARSMPDHFTSEKEYLTSMQAHAEREYFAATHYALQSLTRQAIHTATSSQSKARVLEVSEHKFARLRVLPRESANAQELDAEEQQSLSKNLLKVKGIDKLLLVTAEEVSGNTREIKVSCPGSASTYLACHGQITFRSVAYVGSDIQRYKDAALVLHDAKLGKLPPGTSALMQQVMSPSATAHVLAGCFNRTSDLCTSVVPANVSQKQIVLNLQGGLEAIQGPPGTGKSTTIFHIVSNKVLSGRKVAITATRNQAINAVTEKLTYLNGGILVFGNLQRLCREARHSGSTSVTAPRGGLVDQHGQHSLSHQQGCW